MSRFERKEPKEFATNEIVDDTYLVVECLGRGAMSHVYRVRHMMLDTEYALKTLSGNEVDDLAWKRFQVEGQAIATLHHPNVVSIYNFGLHQGVLPYYAMDLLQGTDLDQMLRQNGPLPVETVVKIFLEVCTGIGYVHSKGMIHRDIKPGNIFVLSEPSPAGATVKIVDFGMVKLTQARSQINTGLTSIGVAVGTPNYMSPEQCRGQEVDARSDVYSLGCTLFHLLTGDLPFTRQSSIKTMLAHVSEAPPTLKMAAGGKEFPSRLEHLIATSIAKDPAERYQTIEQMANDLSAVLDPDIPLVVLPPPSADKKADNSTLEYTSVKDLPRKNKAPAAVAAASPSLLQPIQDFCRQILSGFKSTDEKPPETTQVENKKDRGGEPS